MELVEISQAQRDHLKQRFEHGSSSDALLQAESGLANAKSNLTAAEQRCNTLERQQAVLRGGYPDTSADSMASTVLPELPGAVPGGLPATLVERRPDLTASAAELRSLRFNSEAADAALYPALALTASGGTSSNELSDLLDGDFKVWSLGASLTAPLFHGGTLNAQADAAQARANASGLAFAQQVLRAFAEVEIALDSEQLLMQRLEQVRSENLATDDRADYALERFRKGVGPATSVYQTRMASIQSDSTRQAVELLVLINRIDLYLALGGGFNSAN